MLKLNLRAFAPIRRKSKLNRMDGIQWVFIVILTLVAIFMLLPLVFIFNHAFKPFSELFAYPPTIFVRHPSMRNFTDLMSIAKYSVVPISRYMFNSIIVTVGAVVGVTVISAMCAYPISKIKFPGHQVVFSAIILTLMFAPDVVQIPRYVVVSYLGIMNTYWGHWLPMLATPVSVFLLKQFIDQIPNELLEAAKIDGAREHTIFFKVIIPLCMPAVATVAILTFQSAWGNVETSTLFMQDESMKTFPFYISTLTAGLSNNIARQGVVAAAALVLFIPNLIIFLVFQSRVIATMAHSGIK